MVDVAFAHCPAAQVVPAVHASASSHTAPSFVGFGLAQAPDAQEPTVHVSPVGQMSGGCGHTRGAPTHVPCVHLSWTVQYWPSSHAPFSFEGTALQPAIGSQKPVAQTPFKKLQSTGGPD